MEAINQTTIHQTELRHAESMAVVSYFFTERTRPSSDKKLVREMVLEAFCRAYGAKDFDELPRKIQMAQGRHLDLNASPELQKALLSVCVEATSEQAIDRDGLALLNGAERMRLDELARRLTALRN